MSVTVILLLHDMELLGKLAWLRSLTARDDKKLLLVASITEYSRATVHVWSDCSRERDRCPAACLSARTHILQ